MHNVSGGPRLHELHRDVGDDRDHRDDVDQALFPSIIHSNEISPIDVFVRGGLSPMSDLGGQATLFNAVSDDGDDLDNLLNHDELEDGLDHDVVAYSDAGSYSLSKDFYEHEKYDLRAHERSGGGSPTKSFEGTKHLVEKDCDISKNCDMSEDPGHMLTMIGNSHIFMFQPEDANEQEVPPNQISMQKLLGDDQPGKASTDENTTGGDCTGSGTSNSGARSSSSSSSASPNVNTGSATLTRGSIKSEMTSGGGVFSINMNKWTAKRGSVSGSPSRPSSAHVQGGSPSHVNGSRPPSAHVQGSPMGKSPGERIMDALSQRPSTSPVARSGSSQSGAGIRASIVSKTSPVMMSSPCASASSFYRRRRDADANKEREGGNQAEIDPDPDDHLKSPTVKSQPGSQIHSRPGSQTSSRPPSASLAKSASSPMREGEKTTEESPQQATATAKKKNFKHTQSDPVGIPGRHSQARKSVKEQQRAEKEEEEKNAAEQQGSPEPEKKPRGRVSLLVQIRPRNLEQCQEEFFASGCKKNPQFTYAGEKEEIENLFAKNSSIDKSLMPESKHILEKTLKLYGTAEAYMHTLYGDDYYTEEQMEDFVVDYLRELRLEDKVSIRRGKAGLSAACVTKSFVRNIPKYEVMLTKGPTSKIQAQGIVDHEIGTHLLRMMNEDTQVWSNQNLVGNRKKYGLTVNPWITEEGLATLNTFLSFKNKLLYPQAMRYYAVCRGTELGFVDLYADMTKWVPDPVRRFKLCARVKRGLHDTGGKGSFYIDQAYFLGAVQILRHLEEIPNLSILYAGQIALQELGKINFLMRTELIRMPIFLSTEKKVEKWKTHCRELLKENELEHIFEKPRVIKEFFLKKVYKNQIKKDNRVNILARKSVTLNSSFTLNNTIDSINRSNSVAVRKPNTPTPEEGETGIDVLSRTIAGIGADCGINASIITAKGGSKSSKGKSMSPTSGNRDLGKGSKGSASSRRQSVGSNADDIPEENNGAEGTSVRRRASTVDSIVVESRPIDAERLARLARPKKAEFGGSSSSTSQPLPKAPFKFYQAVNVARLVEMAKPKKVSVSEEPAVKKPKKKKKKKKTKSKKTDKAAGDTAKAKPDDGNADGIEKANAHDNAVDENGEKKVEDSGQKIANDTEDNTKASKNVGGEVDAGNTTDSKKTNTAEESKEDGDDDTIDKGDEESDDSGESEEEEKGAADDIEDFRESDHGACGTESEYDASKTLAISESNKGSSKGTELSNKETEYSKDDASSNKETEFSKAKASNDDILLNQTVKLPIIGPIANDVNDATTRGSSRVRATSSFGDLSPIAKPLSPERAAEAAAQIVCKNLSDMKTAILQNRSRKKAYLNDMNSSLHKDLSSVLDETTACNNSSSSGGSEQNTTFSGVVFRGFLNYFNNQHNISQEPNRKVSLSSTNASVMSTKYQNKVVLKPKTFELAL